MIDTQDELLRYETDEPFVQTLITNLEGLLRGFKDSLTTSNYDALIGLLTAEVTARLEKGGLKSTFNRVRTLDLSCSLLALVIILLRIVLSKFLQISVLINLI